MGASITTRVTRAGGKRYAVRYRLGGRAWPVRNAGTFPTMKEARARRDLVAGEIAAGRDPAVLLEQVRAAPAAAKTFKVWAQEYRESRVDLADETRAAIETRTRAMDALLGDRDLAAITPQMVVEWVAGQAMKPSSLKKYMQTMRAVFDYAGVDPNPARDQRVRLPRDEHVELEPPSAADVAAIIAHTPRRWRLALQTLAGTGLRVGELHALEWRDVDAAGSRVRVRHGKSAAARRWVAVPADVMDEILEATPPDDRTPQRRVFAGATPDVLRVTMSRACKAAGIALYSPHDLRHRYASMQVARGVPLPMLAAHLGHSKKTLTLDTYSHVILADGS